MSVLNKLFVFAEPIRADIPSKSARRTPDVNRGKQSFSSYLFAYTVICMPLKVSAPPSFRFTQCFFFADVVKTVTESQSKYMSKICAVSVFVLHDSSLGVAILF